MLEKSIERFFQEIADREQPQSRVSIQRALRDGRARLRRRRRLRAIGTPALAAIAVAAIAVSSIGLPTAGHPAGHKQASATATARQFSALSPYATFGWLPASEPVVHGHKQALANLNKAGTGGWIDAASESLNSGPWMLEVYAIGACRQVGNQLHCGNDNPGWTAADQRADNAGRYVTPNFCASSREVPAPPVDGHQAFWLSGSGTQCLNWEYTPGGWATLFHFNEIRPGKQLVLRIASAVRFGGHQPLFKFATPLRRLAGKWRVIRSEFAVTHGALLAGDYSIKDGSADIEIHITPANAKHNKCERFRTPPRLGGPGCRVINGYYVNVPKPPKLTTPSCPPGKICAPPVNFVHIWASDADGWNVDLSAGPRHFASLFTVFEHLTIAGRNPAAWTTKPIS